MPSTGNDIVCLDLIDKERSNNSRFYAKILAPSEEILGRLVLSDDLPFEHFVWLCWSVKESAFKYLQRENPGLVFSPVSIVMLSITAPSFHTGKQTVEKDWEGDADGEENYKGSLAAGGNIYYFRSKITTSTIATIVSSDVHFSGVAWGIQHIGPANADQHSAQVRSFVLKRLQTFFPGKTLLIDKAPQGYPVIREGSHELALPVSFAHHGSTVSYSLQLAS